MSHSIPHDMSHRWLVVAITMTLVVGAAVVLAFALALGLPRGHVVATVPPVADADAFVVAFTRLPGGPLEWSTYSALVEAIGRSIDRPVAIRFVKGVDETKRLFADGRLDAGFVSVYGYLAADEAGLVDLVATPVIGGQVLEASVLVVKSDCDMTVLDDARGQRFVAAEPPSIGGYGYAAWLLDERGQAPESFFGSVDLVTTHEESLQRLWSGSADIACVNRSQLASWPEGSFRVIATSPEFGMPPLVVSRDVDPDERAALLDAVRGFRDEGHSDSGGSMIERFTYTEPSAYVFARTVTDFLVERGVEYR